MEDDICRCGHSLANHDEGGKCRVAGCSCEGFDNDLDEEDEEDEG